MKTEALSHKETILMMLQLAGSKGVCGTVFLEEHIARYSGRISELRQDGHGITTRRCENEWHRHKTAQWEFVLDWPTQPSLW